MFLLFGVLFYLSDTLEKKHQIDGIAKGALLSIPLLFLSVSSYLAGKLIGNDKIRMRICVLIGMILLALSFAGLWWNHSFYPLFLFMSIGGIGIGIALPSLDALITEELKRRARHDIFVLQQHEVYRCCARTAGFRLYDDKCGVADFHRIAFVQFSCTSACAV